MYQPSFLYQPQFDRQSIKANMRQTYYTVLPYILCSCLEWVQKNRNFILDVESLHVYFQLPEWSGSHQYVT